MKVKSVLPDGTLDYDKVAETSVGPMEFPFVFIAYKFPPPGALIGRDPDSQINFEIVGRTIEEEFRKFAPGDKDGFRVGPMNVDSYCRMLAKISHAYATAELGEIFKPALRGFIRGAPLQQAWHWVGGDLAVPPAEQHLHDLQWRISTVAAIHYVVVTFRLFSFIGSPRYHIVVGELAVNLDQLPGLEQLIYTIDVKTPLPIDRYVSVNG